jgi:S-adenosyl-L-methionine hydrolase (adenosine-forming)
VSKGIVTFTTDFGIQDHFVGVMKGVVLGINSEAVVIDICNTVPPYDVLAGALTIGQAYSYYPAGTVHVVVVDPGVGTARRPIVADTGKYVFVGPDNGVLSLVFERQERVTVRHVTAEHYFLRPVSTTFQGRDIFAAVAGHVSRGVDLARLGDPVSDYVRLQVPQPRLEEKRIVGTVLKFDRFGNIVTNIGRRAVAQFTSMHPDGFVIRLGSTDISHLRSAYAQAAAGELFGILGSMGYLEIATNRGSAAEISGAKLGDVVELIA